VARARRFVQDPLFDVTVRLERRYYRQMLDALIRSGFGTSALEAELTVAKLFGTVWAAQSVPRDGSVEEAFGLGLVEYAAVRPHPTAVALLRTVEVIAPVREVRDAARTAADDLMGRGLPGPQWTPPVGSATPAACWAFEDVYGDQTTVVTEFTYGLPPPGGGSAHAVVLRIDHAASGAATDAQLSHDPAAIVADMRREATGRTVVLRPIDQPWARRLQAQAIARTDLVGGVSVWPRFADLRALALSRLAVLADGPDPLEPVPVPTEALVAEFLASREAAGLPDPDLTAAVVARLVDFARLSDSGQVARVSPSKWELLLTDWWPRFGVPGDVAPVLRAWSTWAGRRMALPDEARSELAAALESALR
jgi:hypothetical protein